MENKTVTIDETEYHALQLVADMARKQYLLVHNPTNKTYLEQLPNPSDWDAAVEALDA